MVKSIVVVSSILLFLISGELLAEGASKKVGGISGRISPTDASVRIVAKRAGTEYKVRGNIKGEVALIQGGDFTIHGLPPGKYDLLFFLQGQSREKFFATRWSEIVVEPDRTVSGINYRLTPRKSEHLIDEVLVAFKKEIRVEEAEEIIRSADCIVKDTPLDLGGTTIYTVDIPDDKSVDDMIKVFQKKKGVAFAEANGIITVE